MKRPASLLLLCQQVCLHKVVVVRDAAAGVDAHAVHHAVPVCKHARTVGIVSNRYRGAQLQRMSAMALMRHPVEMTSLSAQ